MCYLGLKQALVLWMLKIPVKYLDMSNRSELNPSIIEVIIIALILQSQSVEVPGELCFTRTHPRYF